MASYAARAAFIAKQRRDKLIQRTKSLTERDLDPDNAKRKNLLDLLRDGEGTSYLTEIVESEEGAVLNEKEGASF